MEVSTMDNSNSTKPLTPSVIKALKPENDIKDTGENSGLRVSCDKSGICPATKLEQEKAERISLEASTRLSIKALVEVYLSQHIEDHKSLDGTLIKGVSSGETVTEKKDDFDLEYNLEHMKKQDFINSRK